ncbi:LLM class oxidoreductase [Myroides odoratimimus]|uniref:BA3436 family luciferase-type oxidoreductase n=1 Tax=Myroides odoratimimus CIP 101113 TaxID=883154 RepID=A0AAV3F2J1_9FLAO|nr:LLM class oxidoreductase [Myroides odoratimimus]EHO11646.1 BA3436 family luciferase-type oxidoreductase [Myroides odoratimimus CIP 101113]MDM1537134.1 LLM class oxidoreductase [Myroides odoratimimus]MDM1676686.1 LLM class oxidoreductase [Myroides odoratimimus]MDX4974882.1 LLM class oxidoreductase [Myroides odoratimimus]
MNSIFKKHKTFNKVFTPGKLSLGIFLPLQVYDNNINIFNQHLKYIQQIDTSGFAALWVRDIPVYDPSFRDVGQVYDPLSYLAYIAGQTTNIALGTASIVLPLHHPISLAKTTASIDQFSNGRLLLGVGSGDRYAEFPAFNKSFERRGELFREVLQDMQTLHTTDSPKINSSITQMQNLDLVPKPLHKHIPTLVTGASQQSLDWIATHADGWITYPGPTTTNEDTLHLEQKIKAFRDLIPNGTFKPHMTNEWIELDEDPHYPRTPLRGGFVLKTGRLGLIELLHKWQEIGVNHAAIGIQFGKRDIGETLDELAKEVLPYFNY